MVDPSWPMRHTGAQKARQHRSLCALALDVWMRIRPAPLQRQQPMALRIEQEPVSGVEPDLGTILLPSVEPGAQHQARELVEHDLCRSEDCRVVGVEAITRTAPGDHGRFPSNSRRTAADRSRIFSRVAGDSGSPGRYRFAL